MQSIEPESLQKEQVLATLIALAFVRAHVAAACVLLVGTQVAALIGFQQMAIPIGAASGVSGINRRAPGE